MPKAERVMGVRTSKLATMPKIRRSKPSTEPVHLHRGTEYNWRYDFDDFDIEYWLVTEDEDPRSFPPDLDDPRVQLDGEETLNLYGIPKYVKTSFERWRRVAHRSGLEIPKGVGVGACLAYGLHGIAKAPQVQPLVEAVKDIDDIEVPLDEEVMLYGFLDRWTFSPPRPDNSPSERWSPRTSSELTCKLYSLRSVLQLEDRSMTSALALVAICAGLCQLPNINPDASDYMQRTVESFLRQTEIRTQNIQAVLERCRKRNGG